MENMNDNELRHIHELRTLAPECAVLLKKRGDFPLREARPVALYGGGARRTVKGGTGSGDVNSRSYVTAEQGLEAMGFTVTTKSWLDAYDRVLTEAHHTFIAKIKDEAKRRHVSAALIGMGAVMPEPEYQLPLTGEGDTAIYVLARISGEGSDRNDAPGDLRLTDTEVRDILACQERYDHFLLVLNVGGPVDLTPVKDVDNILVLSQLGAVTGTALADIVLGITPPSGKLTTTWAAAGDYPRIGEFGDPDETRYKEGIYVGYRWFEAAGAAPMYPFGYGLGWTDFVYGAARVTFEGTVCRVRVPVFNAGSHRGREAVQVYVSVPAGKLDQPVKALAGWTKTSMLAPGESQEVDITFNLRDLASYDASAALYILEKGQYIVRVGPDSARTVPAAALDLPETVAVRKVTNVGGKPDFTDWKPPVRPREELPENLPVLPVDPEAFRHLKWPEPANPTKEAAERAAKLTREELVYLCHGIFSSGPASVIGSASAQVAGAAGETYGGLPGVPGLVMADGPAGLRLSQHYFKDDKGAHAVGSALPAGMEELLPGPAAVMKLLQTKPKGQVYDQYCTAIPIGTALAQSWNRDLCERVGRMVGEEMDLFGVHLWLAPALNIHRSVLCGRNFEYYSEDPLVSGVTAAAVTRGVQSRKGRGVTVKHFCCNNQELNRYGSNSQVSERALREIYLKGFEICVREGDPAALMTSYNLLNGVHTSEREDLAETVLRREWGWAGLVMTDWVIAAMGTLGKHPTARSGPTIAAGNLFMPGSRRDWNDAMKYLKGPGGAAAEAKARRTAAWVLDAAWRARGRDVPPERTGK